MLQSVQKNTYMTLFCPVELLSLNMLQNTNECIFNLKKTTNTSNLCQVIKYKILFYFAKFVDTVISTK